jgi:hypothetical protein
MLRFAVADMRRFAGKAWGPLGVSIVEQWCKFNQDYFANALRPVPLVITHTQPSDRRLAFCSYTGAGRTITLNLPTTHRVLVADGNTLLHEMVHQFLFERGEDASHAGAPWWREIMRLTKIISGADIWAGPSKTMRSERGIIRVNAPHPETGAESLPQKVIARWPHDALGIDFGRFERR